MNMAATHSYRAVPSMLMVAPSGSVKEDILLETPLLFSTALMVRGRVADEEEVEKAVSRGVVTALKCFSGFALPINRVIKGSVMKA